MISASNKVYACEVSRRDHLVRKEGGGYDKDEYHEFPERYASMFSIKVRKRQTLLSATLYCLICYLVMCPGSFLFVVVLVYFGTCYIP